MSIQFGIIGYGFMGHEHLTMLSDFEGIDVTAICDMDPEQLKDVPAGIRTYTDAEELIHDPEVQVVLISANNNQHLKLVKAAAEAKKDIICEKPDGSGGNGESGGGERRKVYRPSAAPV